MLQLKAARHFKSLKLREMDAELSEIERALRFHYPYPARAADGTSSDDSEAEDIKGAPGDAAVALKRQKVSGNSSLFHRPELFLYDKCVFIVQAPLYHICEDAVV